MKRREQGYLPDYKRPDGSVGSIWSSPTHIPALEEAGLALSIAGAALHIASIVHRDQLSIPREYRNANNLEQIADLLARRFDPLYNLVKLQIHSRTSKKEANRTTQWSGAGIVGNTAGLPALGPIGFGIECFFAERALVHMVRDFDALDKLDDESSRIAKDWQEQMRIQISEASSQAHLDLEHKLKLIELVYQRVEARHEEFARVFGNDIGKKSDGDVSLMSIGKKYGIKKGSQLEKAIATGVEFYELNKRRNGELPSRIHPIRRGRAKDLEGSIVTYYPDPKWEDPYGERYVTLSELAYLEYPTPLRRR